MISSSRMPPSASTVKVPLSWGSAVLVEEAGRHLDHAPLADARREELTVLDHAAHRRQRDAEALGDVRHGQPVADEVFEGYLGAVGVLRRGLVHRAQPASDRAQCKLHRCKSIWPDRVWCTFTRVTDFTPTT